MNDKNNGKEQDQKARDRRQEPKARASKKVRDKRQEKRGQRKAIWP